VVLLPARNMIELFVRGSDPDTSLAAAIKAARASKEATRAVFVAMSDGVPRIDQEIREACIRAGYVRSLSTIQHGRLALSNTGEILDTGLRDLTKDGEKSIIWRIAESSNVRVDTPQKLKSRKISPEQALIWSEALRSTILDLNGRVSSEIIFLEQWLRQAT